MASTTPRVTLTRTLDGAIREDTRAAWNGVVATFPLTKRGIMKAARVYRETRDHDEQCWGNIGCGSLTLTVAGRDYTDTIAFPLRARGAHPLEV